MDFCKYSYVVILLCGSNKAMHSSLFPAGKQLNSVMKNVRQSFLIHIT